MSIFDTIKNVFNEEKEKLNLNKTVPFISPMKPSVSPLFNTIQKKIEPKITNKDIVDFGKEAIKLNTEVVGRQVITRPIRTVIKSFEEIGGYLGDPNYKPEPYVPTKDWEKALYGEAPIESYPEQGKKMFRTAKELTEPVIGPDGKVLFGGVDKRIAYPMAFFGTLGAPLADLTPGGGEKKEIAEKVFGKVADDIAELIVKSADDVNSAELLRKYGISDDIAKESAPIITAAKNTDEAKEAMRDIASKEIQTVQNQAEKRYNELINKQKGVTVDEATGKKIKTTPELLTADEMDEVKFLKTNKNKPENIILANRAAEISDNSMNWRKSIETTNDEWRQSDILQAVANQSDSADELSDVLKYTKQIENKIGSKADNIKYDVEQKLKSLSGRVDAIKLYEKKVDDLVEEFNNIKKGEKISNPDEIIDIGKIEESVTKKLGLKNEATITRKSIKHIIEQRGDTAVEVLKDIPKVLESPTKIADNSARRADSYLFARMNGKAKAVVLEVTKTPDGNRVVSAYLMDEKSYKKMKDISGRSDVSPLDISPAESEISAALKPRPTVSEIQKERKYITSAKASDRVNDTIKAELSGTYDPKSNKELTERAVARVADNIESAKRMAKTQSSDEAIATGVSLTEHYSDEITKAVTKEEKLKIAKEAADIINKQAEVLTEAGRTIQAAALIGKQTPEGMLRFTARKIKEYNKKNPRNMVPELTPENVVTILEKGKKIEGMTDGIKKDIAIKDLVDNLQEMLPSPMWKKIIHVWKAGLLTGVKTSGMNISSSFFNGVAENIKDIPATGIDLATSLITGKRTKTIPNPIEYMKGGVEGAKKGWDYLRTGVQGIEETALEHYKVTFDSKLGKMLGKYADTVYRILGAEDSVFYYGALKKSLVEQAEVAIMNTKQTFKNSSEKRAWVEQFINNPTDEVLELATLDAKMATFKNDTALGQMAQSLQNAPILGPLAQMTILPFAKTPSAVATMMFNYTPGGLLTTFYKNFIKGEFNQKDFAEGLGRFVTGAGALWLGSELYKKGKISLGYPDTEKEKAEWEATGKTPNSILINGKWVPLVTFGPAGATMGIGGYFQNGKDETGSISGGATQGFFGGMKQLTEQTFLTGVKSLIDVINEPEKKAELYVGRIIGSIVPTIISDTAQAIDEKQRKSINILDPLKSRIPVLRETLLPKLNVWGQPIERNRTAAGTVLSPIRLSNQTYTPLDTEVERLNLLGEDIRPTKVDKTQGGIKLDDKEYYIYQRFYGNLVQKSMNRIIKTNQYQQMSAGEQAEVWEDEIKNIRKGAKDIVLPIIIVDRYDLPETVNPKTATDLVSKLYKEVPSFSKQDVAVQRKVLIKLLEK